MLLERNGCFGGNITQVGVEGFAWYRHEHTVDSEGIGIEFEQRAKAMGAASPEPQSISYALDAEMFKYVADVLVAEAGVTPMLHRLCVAPIMQDKRIQGVITESKSGREALLAKCVIDATGDADVAMRAGAPTHKTPIEEMMSTSVMFSMAGVNKQRFIEAVKADPPDLQGLGRQRRVGHRDHGQGRRSVFAVFAQALQAGRRGRHHSGKPFDDRGHLGLRLGPRGPHLFESRARAPAATVRTPMTSPPAKSRDGARPSPRSKR